MSQPDEPPSATADVQNAAPDNNNDEDDDESPQDAAMVINVVDNNTDNSLIPFPKGPSLDEEVARLRQAITATTLSDEQLAHIADVVQQHVVDKLLSKSRYHDLGLLRIEQQQQQKHNENKDDNKPDGKDGPDNNNDKLQSACIRYDVAAGDIQLTICKEHVIKIQLLSILVRICALVFVWLVMWLLLPQDLLERGGVIFDTLLTFVMCSLIGKGIGAVLGIPPLIAIFLAGLLWGNIGPHFQFLTSGITTNTRHVVGRIGLANILLRTGLAVSPKTLAPAKWNIIAMSVFPLLTEILVHGFMAQGIFDYGGDQLWPFLQAMVVSPSASGVVAAVVMTVQHQGLVSSKRGPPVLLIPACALDMTLGIWGVNFVAGLITRDPNASLVWPVLQGPVQIIVGAIAGVALGFLWYGCLLVFFIEAHRLPHGRYATAFVERVAFNASALLGLLACFCIFMAYYIQSAGGGCIACTMLGATAQYLTTREAEADTASPAEQQQEEEEETKKERYSSPPEHRMVRSMLVTNFAWTWDMLVMPCVFSFGATALDVSSMFNPDVLGLAVGTIFTGMVARSVVTGLCCWSYPMTMSEFIITSICLGGKAFAQVALGGTGKAVVAQLGLNSTSDQARYATYVADTGALSVVFVSPIVVVLLSIVGPKMWPTDAEWEGMQQPAVEQKEVEQEMREPTAETAQKNESNKNNGEKAHIPNAADE